MKRIVMTDVVAMRQRVDENVVLMVKVMLMFDEMPRNDMMG